MRSLSLAAAVAVIGLTGTSAAHADIFFTIEAPGVQSTQVSGVTTMDFDSTPLGSTPTLSSPIGTYSATPGVAVVAANDFGGASGTNYLVIGRPNSVQSVTLTLDGGPAAYFGFWWSAGDVNNRIDLRLGTSLVQSFSTADVIDFLATLPNELDYYGNPNFTPKRNTAQPYGYLNFYGRNGTTFDSVVFRNVDSVASGFETDNHSIRVAPVDNPTGTPITPVPEPSSLIMMGVGICGLTAAGLRRLRRND